MGAVEAEQDLGEDAAHDGELGEVVGVAFEVGAEIEHHRLAARRRQERGQRRPVRAFAACAWRTSRWRAARRCCRPTRRVSARPCGRRLDGQPHARLAAAAQREGRLVVGQHRILGRHDLERLGQALALVDQRLQPGRIAEQQERRAGIALARDVGAVHDDVGRVVAAHAVERQDDLARAHRDAPPVGCQRIAGGALRTTSRPTRCRPGPACPRGSSRNASRPCAAASARRNSCTRYRPSSGIA